MYRPFKPPSFINKPAGNDNDANKPSARYQTPANSKLLMAAEARASVKRPVTLSGNADLKRARQTSDDCELLFVAPKLARPLQALRVPEIGESVPSSHENSAAGKQDRTDYFSAVYRKITTKKHKTWDGDGILTLRGNTCTLQDMTGKMTRCSFSTLSPGDAIRVGSYEAEADSRIDEKGITSGRVFVRPELVQDDESEIVSKPKPEPFKALNVKAARMVPQVAASVAVGAAFKAPYAVEEKVVVAKDVPVPRHNPTGPHALVMPRPKAVPGQQIVDVVVDPLLSKHLRPHQREGVTFLYKCAMGMQAAGGTGAILADEMGLGKTLMTIALVWTLLKQNPVVGKSPVAKKVLIVCPVTLISNWKREFRKWLGRERSAVFAVDSKANLADFTKGRVYQVMIIGYEKVRLVQSELKNVTFDLLVCDEGHRLKSSNNKSAQALKALNTPRRVILTGTPIQNDLGEFFTMIDFVNPGLFASYNTFKKEFEVPIMRSRQPDARKADIELGKARSEGLAQLTKHFVLRRTADVLANYLPPKNEFVVFCKPTPVQLEICRDLLNTAAMKSILKSDDASNHLRAITALKKICNGPKLLLNNIDSDENSLLAGLDLSKARTATSGKLVFLESFLQHLYDTTDEKVVLVSSFTQTLDMLQAVVSGMGASFRRLDGSTAMKKRQELVDSFNKEGQQQSFAFLLSAKSGGAGINLIGASRLVLFDTDWNPSVDLQAMARIHRDGQTRPVYIYRLLTTGCIDEKIYQRQLTKQGLADNLMDGKRASAENSFTATELRDIFNIYAKTACHTHDLLECTCDGSGSAHVKQEVSDEDEDGDDDDDCGWMSASALLLRRPKRGASRARLKALLEYVHVDPAAVVAQYDDLEDKADVIADKVLQTALEDDHRMRVVSYLFRRCVMHG